MKDQKAETITNLLVDLFARLGTPEFLHWDQGRNFESCLLKETCKSLGIKKTRTTAYHPQGNSLIERGNRTILQMLRCYVEKSHEWEKFLPLVLSSFGATKHASTGITPVGDPVWLSIPNGGVSRKLNNKWEGGWYIAEIKSPVNMMIKNKEGNIRVVHINRLQSRILREDLLFLKKIPEAYNQTFKVDERAVSRIISPLDSNESELTEGSKPQKPNGSWEIDVDNTVYENSQQDLLENSKNPSLEYFEELPQNLDNVICCTPKITLKADELANRDDTATPVKGPGRRSQRTRRLPK